MKHLFIPLFLLLPSLSLADTFYQRYGPNSHITNEPLFFKKQKKEKKIGKARASLRQAQPGRRARCTSYKTEAKINRSLDTKRSEAEASKICALPFNCGA